MLHKTLLEQCSAVKLQVLEVMKSFAVCCGGVMEMFASAEKHRAQPGL